MIAVLARLFFPAFLALVLAGCAGGGSNLSPSGPVSIDGPSGLAPVNAFRERNGLAPLVVDQRLMQAAAAHSERMAAREKMDHNLGGPVTRRIMAFGYDWGAAAENLGGGYPSYSAAMTGWTGSAGHRKNLLRPGVTHFGVGVARSPRGVPYWTQIFAAER